MAQELKQYSHQAAALHKWSLGQSLDHLAQAATCNKFGTQHCNNGSLCPLEAAHTLEQYPVPLNMYTSKDKIKP